jgi:hypothetical protein
VDALIRQRERADELKVSDHVQQASDRLEHRYQQQQADRKKREQEFHAQKERQRVEAVVGRSGFNINPKEEGMATKAPSKVKAREAVVVMVGARPPIYKKMTTRNGTRACSRRSSCSRLRPSRSTPAPRAGHTCSSAARKSKRITRRSSIARVPSSLSSEQEAQEGRRLLLRRPS